MQLSDAEVHLISAVASNPSSVNYNILGITQTKLAKYPEALISLEQGLDPMLIQLDESAKYNLLVKILHNKGHIYLKQHNYDQTIYFYNQALKQLEDIELTPMDLFCQKDINRQKIMIQQSLGLAYLEFHEFEKSINLLKQVKVDLEKINGGSEYNFDTALILNNIGLAYIKLSRFTEAEGTLFHSLKVAEFLYKREDHPSIIQVNHNLGLLYERL